MGAMWIISTSLLLIFGVILTVITMRRMATGRISLPGWAKPLLCVAMITALLIILLSLLPPHELTVDTYFQVEYTTPVVPVDPSIPCETSP